MSNLRRPSPFALSFGLLFLSACSLIVPDPPEHSSSTTTTTSSSSSGTGGAGGHLDTVCGDGVVDDGEGCDDGATADGDGCDATCQVENGFTCGSEAPSVCQAVCGDGKLRGEEGCDDGNVVSDDGCDGACAPEDGWSCNGASPTVCSAVCGDGKLRGAEGCDDGNTNAGDGCDGTCAVELGFSCAGEPSVCTSGCGDGVVVGTELCDDGGLANGDGCNDACVVEFGYVCAGSPSVCTGKCGDGYVKAGEACDDGGVLPGDGCGPDCQAEPGYVCAGTPAVCAPTCGDGFVKAPETCDDGNVVGGDGCDASCAAEPGYTCVGEPSACATACGDGVMAGGETCDDGNLVDGDCCTATCAAVPVCEVEDNNSVARATDFASVAVQGTVYGFIGAVGDLDVYAVTVPAGQVASLEAEVVSGSLGSTCASGAIDSFVRIVDATSDILARAEDGGVLFCSKATTPTLDPGSYYVLVEASPYAPAALFDYGLTLRQSVCGDGVRELGEECDDGKTIDGDGCDARCRVEPLVEVETNNSTNLANGPIAPEVFIRGSHDTFGDVDYYQLALPTYADLRVTMWDFGGRGHCDAGDGADAFVELLASDGTVLAQDDDTGPGTCPSLDPAVQTGVRRLAPGTYYLRSLVGGNNAVLPITYYDLAVEYAAECGNLVVEGYEECDGGPDCDATCARIPACNDGFVDSPETCDDGNNLDNDGCSAACALEAQIQEVEPNGTPAEADLRALDPFPMVIQGAFFLSADLGSSSDIDSFRVVVSTETTLHLETFDPSGADCVGLATTVSLLDAAGVSLVSDSGAGIARCGALTITLDPGIYYASVSAQSATLPFGPYSLAASFVTVALPEDEPNDTLGTATPLFGSTVVAAGSHLLGSDLDTYVLDVQPGASLHIEVVEGGAETCESGEVDSAVWVYDMEGRLLASDDDRGRGACSVLDGLGPSPPDASLHDLPGGSYFIVVGASPVAVSDSTGQFDYDLVVNARFPGCWACGYTPCVSPSDCQSGVCQLGICQPSSCADGAKNGGESDVDCGGVCAGCGGGLTCLFDGDCQSGVCSSGQCAPPFPSCVSGLPGAASDCGPTGDDDCCASPLVPGGTFLRSYDGVYFFDASSPATVSDFRLDKYEVTVGRFREFVAQGGGLAANAPASGAGAHPKIAGSGWDPTWNGSLAGNAAQLTGFLTNQTSCTYTTTPGANESKPMSCVAWYEAFAFCAWDGGFLPTEAEWSYAAAGGNQQRAYPWSSPATDVTISPSYAVYNNLPASLAVGSKSPLGDGLFGHADLTGNVGEWVLDYDGNYPVPCVDCFNNVVDTHRVVRGGSYQSTAGQGLVGYRASDPAAGTHFARGGFRCARNP